MNKYSVYFLLLILTLSGCKDSSIQSHYTDTYINIDGKLDEWTVYPLQHFEEQHFSVSFRNNSTDLYIMLATRDRRIMKIVQTSGIDIWLDIGKKRKNYGLHFVGNIDSLEFSQMNKKTLPPNQKQPKRKRQKPGTILFSDFGNEYLIEKMKTTGPSAVADMYKSAYLLEVRIPLSNKHIEKLKENDKKKINLGIALGIDRSEMKKQMQASRQSGGMGGGGRGGGRGGGGQGGGRGGGKMGGGDSGRPQPIGKIEKWFTVALENKS